MNDEGVSRRTLLRAALAVGAAAALGTAAKIAPALEREPEAEDRDDGWEERKARIEAEFDSAQRKPRFL